MKKLLSLGLIGLLTLSMIGCAPATNENNDDTEFSTITSISDSNEEDSKEEYYVSPTDDLVIGEVITIGSILKFDGNTIHIISGDLVEVFEYDNQWEKEFYIGQMVQLTKAEDKNQLTAYEQEDYTITHTNMGHMIEQITGTVLTLGEDSIVIENDKGTFDINTYESIDALVGDEVTAYVMSNDKEISSIMLLNDARKLELTITAISRDEDGGMDLSLIGSDKGEYVINASYETLEFDIAQLKVDDVLTVYHNGIMESWPMQINTILIRK